MGDIIRNTVNNIDALNEADFLKVQKRLDNLSKPPGSLGRLEEAAARYVAIRGMDDPPFKKKTIFTFAGDHGVAVEGVSAFPKEVTPQMVLNFLNGGAGVNVLANHVGAKVVVVDMGIDYNFEETEGLLNRKVQFGTQNMAVGSAMSREDAEKAVETGIALALEWADKGTDIFGTGDMGIANTTPSSAIVSVISGKSVEEVTGRGTGIDDAGLIRKREIIEKAIAVNSPDPSDPLDVLAKVGGFEIGGIAGLILGAASKKVPVVVDGFISGAAALIAFGLQPRVQEYIFASHLSVESGHKAAYSVLDQKPFLDLGLRLGEGTGSALCIGLIEAGYKILTQMATFDEAGVSEG